jgi:dihydrodipicolinate synthase/N-acetylneuraminate lyase
MGKPARCKGLFITPEKFYEKVIFYRGKPDLSYVMPDYYQVDLDDDTFMNFVSPNNYYILKRNKENDMFYTTIIEYEETISILKIYIRRDKLKWLLLKNRLKINNVR